MKHSLLRTAHANRQAHQIDGRHRTFTSAVRKSISLLSIMLCLASAMRGRQTNHGIATVEGTVFVRDASSNESVVPGANVKLTGPVVLTTKTDADGLFTFTAVPTGTYTIEGFSPDLKVSQTVQITSSSVHVLLELKPAEVTSSVVVTADQAESKDPAASTTISDKTLRDAPNANERFESSLPLVPGVVRGPDGHVNLKGTRSAQSGALVNSANVTDPVTGGPAINLPIDVVSSVQVIANPYDPQYGKFTGALSTVATKTGNYDKFHFSIQNIMPRVRDRDGTIMGIGSTTPRATFTGPILKDRLAVTQSFEYRYVRTPVNSLPPDSRDTKLESFDSYTQFDLILTAKQTATISFAVYPQKLDFLGLNTFLPQPATPDFHQRGYQIYAQHRYIVGRVGLLSSQFSYKKFDTDTTAQSDEPYRLLLETTEGGFFNRQARRTSRVSWNETYRFAPWQFAGTHELTVGLGYEHSGIRRPPDISHSRD